MKRSILLLAVLITFGAIAYGQSSNNQDDQPNNIVSQSFTKQKEALNSMLDNYYETLNLTPAQQGKADKIADKYFDKYKSKYGDFSNRVELNKYRRSLYVKAAKEMKPHLNEEQWKAIKDAAEQRKIELD